MSRKIVLEAWKTCQAPGIEKAGCFTKIFVLSRPCVFVLDLITVFIAGIIALIELGGYEAAINGKFNWMNFLLIAVGILLVHVNNNYINDYFDYKLGVDEGNYFRTLYGPHPILSGLLSEKQVIGIFITTSFIDLGILLYFFWYLNFDWVVVYFAVAGFLLSVFYVAPPFKLKHYGLGEFILFLVYGPLIIGGAVYVLAGNLTLNAMLLSVPNGVFVSSILLGKHLDKFDLDKQKGIHTLPVILGKKATRWFINLILLASMIYITVLSLLKIIPAWGLLALIIIPRFLMTAKVISKERPAQNPRIKYGSSFERLLKLPSAIKEIYVPEKTDEGKLPPPGENEVDWTVWPLWYSAWTFQYNEALGKIYALILLLSLFLPWYLPL